MAGSSFPCRGRVASLEGVIRVSRRIMHAAGERKGWKPIRRKKRQSGLS